MNLYIDQCDFHGSCIACCVEEQEGPAQERARQQSPNIGKIRKVRTHTSTIFNFTSIIYIITWLYVITHWQVLKLM